MTRSKHKEGHNLEERRSTLGMLSFFSSAAYPAQCLTRQLGQDHELMVEAILWNATQSRTTACEGWSVATGCISRLQVLQSAPAHKRLKAT